MAAQNADARIIQVTGKRLDVLAVGEPLAEFNHLGTDRFRLGFGGDVSNVAVAVTRLGGRAGMACRLGGDHLGDLLQAFWRDEGVITDMVRVDAAQATGSYFIYHDDRGHRFTYQRKRSAASHWGPEDAAALDLLDVSIVHFSGITQAISASCAEGCDRLMARCTSEGTALAYDPNFRPLLWSLDAAQEGLRRVLAHQPILLPGLEDARLLIGLERAEDIVAALLQKGARMVALTAGDDGVYIGDAGGITHIPGHPAPCVDASGAGDCFDGAFLLRLSAGDTLAQAATFANKAASLSVQRSGAAKSFPTVSQL